VKTRQVIGLALLVFGAAAFYLGHQSTGSPADILAETLTGRYSDETMALLLGGATAAIVGLAMIVLKGR
jgi:hypothetical protein